MILKQYPSKEEFTQLSLKYNVIPLCVEILADTETPVSILQKFYATNNAVAIPDNAITTPDNSVTTPDNSVTTPDNAMFLLESVEGGENWARYSFMGLSAKSHVKIFADYVSIEENNELKKIPHHGDPLNILKQLISQYNPADIKDLPRFWSGLTGYMTYEMVSFFEEISCHLPENRPYAHFIIPNAMIIFDNINHTLTCVSISYTDGRDVKTCYQESCRHLVEIIETINKPIAKSVNIVPITKAIDGQISPDCNDRQIPPVCNDRQIPPVCNDRQISSDGDYKKESFDCNDIQRTPEEDIKLTKNMEFLLTPETDHNTYIQGVKKIKEHIVAGDIIQAVYSQLFTSNTPVDPVMLYRAQRYINPSPYMFFMNFDECAIVGSSPETMVRLENKTATLRPIAGTRSRGKNEQEDRFLADDLLNDEKERAEHLMLVDLGRNDLGRVAEVGTVQVTDLMFVERYSHVMHLVSNITCEMKQEFDVWDLLRATFPAGTLSGAPKIRAMEIISDIEKKPRGIYGGAAGYISFSGNMDLAITIRTATVEKNIGSDLYGNMTSVDGKTTVVYGKITAIYGKMTVQAGAGIVADSDPEKEYQECVNKARSVERALKLALQNSTMQHDECGGESC